MVTSRELVRPTVAVFLPSIVFLMVGIPVIEPVIRGHNVLQSLKELYLPLVVAEPLLMAAGYAIGLWLVRGKLNHGMLSRPWLHVVAGVVSVLALGLVSVFSQGAHLPWIITASVASGVLAAVVFFGIRFPHGATTASA